MAIEALEDPRFGGLARLYGPDALARLAAAHVCVIGIGGVGSWTVEALARSGIGALTLVDLDEVCVSNTNRQLHALTGTEGRAKVAVMADRARAINPACQVVVEQVFFTPKTAERLLAPGFTCVVDAIDHPDHKALLIARCMALGVPVVTTGGAGGHSDPTAVRRGDVTRSVNDGLLRRVRRALRREHGFPENGPWGVRAVWSKARPGLPAAAGCAPIEGEAPQRGRLRIDCTTGYGTASYVTGTFGLAAAACAVEAVLGLETPNLD